jgi:hypothetical protein
VVHADAAGAAASRGLVAAGRLLALGVRSGVAGVVSKPRKGLGRDGVPGLLRGVSQGLVGAAVKPCVGVLDAVATGACVR